MRRVPPLLLAVVAVGAAAVATVTAPVQADAAVVRAAATAATTPTIDVRTAPTPTPAQYVEVDQVACPAPGYCVAAGNYRRTLSAKPLPLLDVRIGGGAWRSVAVALPTGATTEQLTGVACASTTECYALGYSDATSPVNVVLHLVSGTLATGRWAPLAVTSTIGFALVSCPSPGHCVAAGPSGATGYGYAVLNGHSTTVRTITTPGTGTDRFRASAMDCADLDFCSAVGTVHADGTATMYEVRYDHARLSVHRIPSPDTDATGNPVVQSIDCPGTGICAVTGYYETGNQVTRELSVDPMYAELDRAPWVSHRITLPSDAGRQDFHGADIRAFVSCPTFAGCVGAGNYFAGSDDSTAPRTEQIFAGTGAVPHQHTDAVADAGDTPDDLDCPTTTRCVLSAERGVGVASNGYPRNAGVLTIDTAGTITRLSLTTKTANGSVTDVRAACPSATFCGVAYSSDTDPGRPDNRTSVQLATLAG